MGAEAEAGSTLPKWPFLILFSVVPLLVSAGLLQLISTQARPLSTSELALLVKSLALHPRLPGTLSYAAMLVVHLFTSAAAIAVSLAMLRETPGRKSSAAVGVLLALGLILLLPLMADARIRAYDVSYYAYRDIYSAVPAAAPNVARAIAGLSALDIAIFLPTAIGIAAVAMMAAAATGQVRLLERWTGDPELDEEVRLCIVYGRLKRCLYVLAMVLVTSTVSASFFFHMPTKLQVSHAVLLCCPSDAVGSPVQLSAAKYAVQHLALVRGNLEAFAAELSLFWGAVFTLTLAAAVGVPMALVQQRLRSFVDRLKPPEHAQLVRTRLEQAGMTSKPADQFKFFITLLAPLASGQVATFLQVAA